MVFTNVINPRSHVSRKDEYRQTLVKRGASLGANATIVCGHTIGAYAFVGAGAVVTKDVARLRAGASAIPAAHRRLGVRVRREADVRRRGRRRRPPAPRAARRIVPMTRDG